MRVVAATGNDHKLKEIRAVLPDWEILSEREAGFTEEVEETGETFLDNALLKARAVCERTGLPALADDSGLCVEALRGAPGVYSSRYAGLFAPEGWNKGNRALLLSNLEGEKNRRAYFVCAVALVYPNGRVVTAEGRTYGQILYEDHGESGFGYDPIFLSDDLGISFGEASEEAKNGVSHRGRALKALKEKL